MVSFSCEACGDILTKKKLDPHRNRCQGATFTCIDCMIHFSGAQYRSHTSCISEDQKYQGALYKEKSKKPKYSSSTKEKSTNHTESQTTGRRITATQQAYVEDVGENREHKSSDDLLGQFDDDRPRAEAPPGASMLSATTSEDRVNVFDFLVASGQTPNASNVNLAVDEHGADVGDSTSLVRYECETKKCRLEHDDARTQYYSNSLSNNGTCVTPSRETERRRTKDSDTKKDKKRKRPHIDVPGDQIMTDAPPILHTGVTGIMKAMMRPGFPPSPDYSGGDATEISPASPSKKTKHSKHSKGGQISNSLFGMITGGVKKTSKGKSKKHSCSQSRKEDSKAIEFRSQPTNGKVESTDGQLVVFKPRADAFLSCVNKGSQSEKGCSMNKALKRFHRDRQASGSNMAKAKEEKELWRTLRMRRNKDGEIVLFTVEEGH
ncbi:hypothetical protein E4U19_006803 [Claviceps sp. Clav32 group G5]|nr:hypothetical protein E4U40_007118 [Claviceps sp. LM458 group G5]KAG6019941.1 hypothetical protein E4U19_006803 [Claviceps sp. Clav32 group G5]KAG6040905.1 hypothetical protein E4U39_006821 [Claviceps sp. Clav50 group G5]